MGQAGLTVKKSKKKKIARMDFIAPGSIDK